MTEEYPTTIIIRRPAKVTTDEHGKSVWSEPIEEVELELMSSQSLKTALAAADSKHQESIQAVADNKEEGIVVRECATGLFNVISERDLQSMLEDSNRGAEGIQQVAASQTTGTSNVSTDGLSLLHTQALRVMLKENDKKEEKDPDSGNKGFNPYDNG